MQLAGQLWWCHRDDLSVKLAFDLTTFELHPRI